MFSGSIPSKLLFEQGCMYCPGCEKKVKLHIEIDEIRKKDFIMEICPYCRIFCVISTKSETVAGFPEREEALDHIYRMTELESLLRLHIEGI